MKFQEVLTHINAEYENIREASAGRARSARSRLVPSQLRASKEERRDSAQNAFGRGSDGKLKMHMYNMGRSITGEPFTGSIDPVRVARFLSQVDDLGEMNINTNKQARQGGSFINIPDTLFYAPYVKDILGYTGAVLRDSVISAESSGKLKQIIFDALKKASDPKNMFNQKPTDWEEVEKDLYKFFTTDKGIQKAMKQEEDASNGTIEFRSMTDKIDKKDRKKTAKRIGHFFARYATEKLSSKFARDYTPPTDPRKVVEQATQIQKILHGVTTNQTRLAGDDGTRALELYDMASTAIHNSLTIDPKDVVNANIQTKSEIEPTYQTRN